MLGFPIADLTLGGNEWGCRLRIRAAREVTPTAVVFVQISPVEGQSLPPAPERARLYAEVRAILSSRAPSLAELPLVPVVERPGEPPEVLAPEYLREVSIYPPEELST
jgi:hypothetical protein